MNKTPMPMSEYREKLLELAKNRQWKLFKAMVEKRKKWYKENGNNPTYQMSIEVGKEIKRT